MIKKDLKKYLKIPHKCLSIIILDSVIYAHEKYHPQIFLEECKYMKENIKTKNYTDMELESQNLIQTMIVIVIMVFILILIMKDKSDSNNNKQIF